MLAQGIGRRLEAFDLQRDGVAGDPEGLLCLYRLSQRREAAVQMLQADTLELAEYLEVLAGAGQHAAGPEQQLVEVADGGDSGLLQGFTGGLVPSGLVEAVFVVPVYGLDAVLVADLEHAFGDIRPGVGGANQQRNVQRRQ